MLTLTLTLAGLPVCAVAQKTEDEIKARLVGRALYLRGQWGKDKLEFDAQGHVSQPMPMVSFTLSGMDIYKVKLNSKELVLEGRRAGLEFAKDVPQRVALIVPTVSGGDPEKMAIRITVPSDGDFTAALGAIFTDTLAEFDSPMPAYWEKFAQSHLLRAADGSKSTPPTTPKLPRPHITPPRLLSSVDPSFTQAAQGLRYQALILVNFVVDKDGQPTEISVLHPAGPGLDEAAVKAVSQYKFQPAMKDGQPVAAELNVEVNFQIF